MAEIPNPDVHHARKRARTAHDTARKLRAEADEAQMLADRLHVQAASVELLAQYLEGVAAEMPERVET